MSTRDLIPPAVWMPALKDATDAWHRRAEVVVPVLDPSLSLAGYRDVLVAMRDVVAALETAVMTQRVALVARVPELQLDARWKVASLDADIAWLSARIGDDNTNARAIGARNGWNATTRVDSVAAALGVLYVLEGGTLGGQIILREIAPRFGVSDAGGAMFYAGYGRETGPMWKRFKQQVEWYGAAHMEELSEATEAAVSAFEDLTSRFEIARIEITRETNPLATS